MFRLTNYLHEVLDPTPIGDPRKPKGPVVIWNLIRRCNLTCRHCYTTSADRDFPGELSLSEIYTVMDDLKAFGVPVLILSGGEPLLHPYLFDISKRAKDQGFYVALSTNGTLISPDNIGSIVDMQYQYVGISLDGMEKSHDFFRQKQGAFTQALSAIRLCRDHGIKAGVRFTLTQDNAADFDNMLDMVENESIDKFYLSHLNYGGRGNKNRKDDVALEMTRQVMTRLFERVLSWQQRGFHCEVVTGNNDADAVFFLKWVEDRFPDRYAHLKIKLEQWGGNSSGVNVANIDNLGRVHPDTFWWHYDLGCVRERPFSEIWDDVSDPLMAGLKMRPRPLKGRCGECGFRNICNGNTRVRAHQLQGDLWAEDPGCYLTDTEIQLGNQTL